MRINQKNKNKTRKCRQQKKKKTNKHKKEKKKERKKGKRRSVRPPQNRCQNIHVFTSLRSGPRGRKLISLSNPLTKSKNRIFLILLLNIKPFLFNSLQESFIVIKVVMTRESTHCSGYSRLNRRENLAQKGCQSRTLRGLAQFHRQTRTH